MKFDNQTSLIDPTATFQKYIIARLRYDEGAINWVLERYVVGTEWCDSVWALVTSWYKV